MGILKNLQNVFRAVRPPCARCPYRLGLVKFVQSPCPACRMDSYRMYDVLTRGQDGFPAMWRSGVFRDGQTMGVHGGADFLTEAVVEPA